MVSAAAQVSTLTQRKGGFRSQGAEERVGEHISRHLYQPPDFDHFAAAQQLRSTSAFLSNLRGRTGAFLLAGRGLMGSSAAQPRSAAPGAALTHRRARRHYRPPGAPPTSRAARGACAGGLGAVCRAIAEPEQLRRGSWAPPRSPLPLLASAAAVSKQPLGERQLIVFLRGQGAELLQLGPRGSPGSRTVRARLNSAELGEVLRLEEGSRRGAWAAPGWGAGLPGRGLGCMGAGDRSPALRASARASPSRIVCPRRSRSRAGGARPIPPGCDAPPPVRHHRGARTPGLPRVGSSGNGGRSRSPAGTAAAPLVPPVGEPANKCRGREGAALGGRGER